MPGGRRLDPPPAKGAPGVQHRPTGVRRRGARPCRNGRRPQHPPRSLAQSSARSECGNAAVPLPLHAVVPSAQCPLRPREVTQMKLATLKNGSRDGALVVVSKDLTRAVEARALAPTLQVALDSWSSVEPGLKNLYNALNAGKAPNAFSFGESKAHSPLPRAYQWCEASVYLVHLERCRKSTNRDLPKSLYTDIGMYQGGSDNFIGTHEPIVVRYEEPGI